MADLRPLVTHAQVLAALGQHFTTPIVAITPVESGQIARTFSFQTKNEAYIVRFNHDTMMNSNLPKEMYLTQKLASSKIPVAPILHAGRLDELHFAISRLLPGQRLEKLSPQQVQQLLPPMMTLLDTIHQVDISATQGYGVFDDQGKGLASSWPDSLLMIASEEKEEDHGYYGKWHRLFEDSFLERDLFEHIHQKMRELLAYCPTERYLLHGNYSLSNILAENGTITAVLDWLGASYGDFVFDIAGLDFWCPWLDVSARFLNYYQEQQREVPAYAERLLCYQCYTALVGLLFFAKGDNEEAYIFTRQRILDKIG